MTATLALLAVLSLSGDPDTAKVSVDFEDQSLTEVLSNLTLLTGVPIELDAAARKKLGDPDKLMVSFKVKDTVLTSALGLLLTPHGLSVKVVDRKKVLVTAK
jgi:hypothetical protein